MRRVPLAEQSLKVSSLIGQLRNRHPGLRLEVQSPTAEERAHTGAPNGHQEIVISSAGPEHYIIPLHHDPLHDDPVHDDPVPDDPVHDDMGHEVWRVGGDDASGVGEFVDDYADLRTAVEAAAAAAADDAAIEETVGRAARIDAEAMLRGGDLDRPAAQYPEQTSPAELVDASDRGRDAPTAVTTVWKSEMTAVAEVRAQVRESAEVTDAAPAAELLREEELELLERVDPAEARTVREVGGRMDWTHRRPERVAEPEPGRRLGRSVDGAD